MKNWWKLCVATVISLGWAWPVSAREVALKVNLPNDWSSENPTPVGFSIDGATGVWMRTESIRKYLQLEVDIKALQEELQITQLKVTAADARLILLDERVLLTEQERDLWKVKWMNENAQRISAESDLHAWWRNPWVWFGVGVVAGGAATTEVVRVSH